MEVEHLDQEPVVSTTTGTSSTSSSNNKEEEENNMMTRRLYNDKRGTPFETREESIQAMRCIMGTTTTTTLRRPSITNVHGEGAMLLSDIPPSALRGSTTTTTSDVGGVCVGIDEAGRGSVLGPMVYGAAFWNSKFDSDCSKIPSDFNDSKQLTEDVRSKLLEKLMHATEIGWCTRIFQASEISRNMLRGNLGETYNLNQMSHDAAMDMIQAILNANVDVRTCYIDTVGNPDAYRRKLERRFPNLEFVVESKADAKYSTCSAASVVAKVLRDRMLENWQFTERFPANNNNNKSTTAAAVAAVVSRDFGSGYPSDPKCKEWMTKNLSDPVFGWNDIVRFSWGPAKKMLLEESNDAVEVTFEADDQDDDDEMLYKQGGSAAIAGKKRQQEQMSAFLRKGRKDLRYPYFERNNLKAVPANLF